MKKLWLLLGLGATLPGAANGCIPTQNLEPKAKVSAPVADAWTQRLALYQYDRNMPFESKTISRETSDTAITEKIVIKGVRGHSVPLYLVLPANANQNAPVPGLVLVHGLGGTIDQMLLSAQLSAARGYASVVPEIVGHGERAGANKNLFGGESQALRDGIIESVGDIRRGLDLLLSRPEVDKNRIGYVGLSLGAIIGTVTTAVDERIKTAVFIVGGADWPLILRQSQEQGARQRRQKSAATASELALLEDIDPKNFAAKIAPRPILLMNGRQDNIIPPAAAKALFDAAKEPKKQIWFEAGHFLPPLDVLQILQTWVDDKLGKASTQSVPQSEASRDMSAQLPSPVAHTKGAPS
jgi:cephalosporin-C deacetylase-like acetyl esterase